MSNNYPVNLFDNLLLFFMNRKLEYREIKQTAPLLKKYIELPYIGKQSQELKDEMLKLIRDFFPHISPNFYFRCYRRLGGSFNLKDRPAIMMRSDVIYAYKCDSCPQSYIGSTSVNLFIRSAQHRGVSHRTGRHMAKPVKSSIREHCELDNHRFSYDNFSILDSAQNKIDLRILESIYIKKLRPQMNDMDSVVPLNICP